MEYIWKRNVLLICKEHFSMCKVVAVVRCREEKWSLPPRKIMTGDHIIIPPPPLPSCSIIGIFWTFNIKNWSDSRWKIALVIDKNRLWVTPYIKKLSSEEWLIFSWKRLLKEASERKFLIYISGEKLYLRSFCFFPRVRYALVFLTFLVKVNTLHLWSLCRNGIKNSVLFYTKFLGRCAPNFNIRYLCPLSVIIVTIKGEKKLAMLWWF